MIVISGYLWTTSTGKIVVGAAGSLQIYLAGDMALDGGGIVNNTNLPKNVAIFGQPGNTYNLEIGTTQAFRGVMYAPEASMTFNNNVTIFGAVVAQAVTFSSTSSPTFHYDTTLRATVFAGIDTPFAVANVRDTTNP